MYGEFVLFDAHIGSSIGHRTVMVVAQWYIEVWSTASQLSCWQLYSAALLGHQATSTMTCYPTQLHYPDTEPTSPCHILTMPSSRLGSSKYQFKVIGLILPELRNCGLYSNPWPSDSPISQKESRCFTHSATWLVHAKSDESSIDKLWRHLVG